MNRTGLRLDPLDNLFFRDGRPFDAATRASGGLPFPQTFAGALRTYLLAQAGFDFAAFSHRRRTNPAGDIQELLLQLGTPRSVVDLRFRGPWLALADNSGVVEPLLRAPVTLAFEREAQVWHRSGPLRSRLPGWPDSEALLPLWRREGPDAKSAEGFLAPAGINAFLAGGLPHKHDWLAAEDLYAFDQRTGIEIDASTLTAAEGRIYGISLLALQPRVKRDGPHRGKQVCLYAEILGAGASDLSFPDPLPLGGEGRHVGVRRVARLPSWTQPEPVENRSLWLLASPAFLPGPRALPAVSHPARLVAAASGPPVAVSGWDVARGGPRATRFAVPAGSVYFVEGSFNPPQDSLCASVEDVAQGWGFLLRGTWNYA